MRIVLNFQDLPIPSAKVTMTNETPAQMQFEAIFSLAVSARRMHVTHQPRGTDESPDPHARKSSQTGNSPESRWPQGLAIAVSHSSRWL